MSLGYFITGTDTGVGKTLIAAALMKRHAAAGRRVAGMKPVASGSRETAAGLRNDDALTLLGQATHPAPYAVVNPYTFAPAIAPHLAARAVGVTLDLSVLASAYEVLAGAADVVIVEGAGGWRVPLGPDQLLSDFPEMLGLKVILVVGLRLGCLNHALLTCEAILRGGKAPLAGWIGNHIDPDFEQVEDNIGTLKERLPAPCLGLVPRLPTPAVEAACRYLEPVA